MNNWITFEEIEILVLCSYHMYAFEAKQKGGLEIAWECGFLFK